MTLLKQNERIDDLQRKGYRLIQNRKQFCFGIDAVLLSWFAKAWPGERVIDLCSGSGVIPILMEARYGEGTYVGLELNGEVCEMASRSVEMNGLAGRIRMVNGDVRTAAAFFGKESFDAVTVNPPYMPKGKGLVNPDPALAAAKHEVFCTLEDVIREAAALLKVGGRFYMVHRPARLKGILEQMDVCGLSPETLTFVHSSAGKDAVLLLVSGVRGRKALMKITAPLFVYNEDGSYTAEVRRIYDE